jgi:hypothetical protein
MSKPMIHAKSAANKFGGIPEDYMPIEQLMDETKSLMPDNRHRAIWHTSYGIFMVEKVFGHTIINSDKKEVSVRDIAEQHVLEDFGGFIPSLQDFLSCMSYENWMHGKGRPSSSPQKDISEMRFD